MRSCSPVRRRVVLGLAAAAAGPTVLAASWPTKPVSIVIPFPPGNTADLVARALAEPLRQAIGQPVVVENRPGAGGNIAMQAVARADKDGHTLLLTTASTMVINPAVYRAPGYDAERDFLPVAVLGSVPMVLIANKSFPPDTLAAFADHVRQNQAGLNYASVGAGTFTHLGMELLARALKVKLTHAAYRGAAPAHMDLVGGQVQFMFDSLASSSAQLKAGRVKALGVTSRRRSPFIQDVPTFAEGGVAPLKDFEVNVWAGLFAPAGTPRAVGQRLNEEVARLLRTPGFRAQLSAQYIRADDPMSMEQFATLVRSDRSWWGGVARSIGLELG